MAFEIETGIPIPGHPQKGRKPLYPFRKLKPGQSIFVPHETGQSRKAMRAAYAHASRHGQKFTHEEAVRGEEKGVRIWREPTEQADYRPTWLPAQTTEAPK